MLSTAPKITNAGKRLLIRAICGEAITFTKFKIGNGELHSESNGEELEDLINPLIDFSINSIDKTSKGYAKIEGSFDSTYITSDFRWRELGLYCKGEDDVEILYAYANDGDNAGVLKANATDVVAEQNVALIIAVGDTENVTAILSESVLYAPKAEFDAHIADESNPHGITAEQLGLGNVPDVATNDQTPTYTTPLNMSELSSGEKLSTAFGKMARAVKAIISHIADKSNPHGVSLTDVGGAAKEHTHSAADINSGVLSILRGGTGTSSLSTLASVVNGSAMKVMTYTGDGAESRFLSVGFTPRFALVFGHNVLVFAFKTTEGSAAWSGSGAMSRWQSSYKCANNGIYVGTNDRGWTMETSTNYNNGEYTAICWR